VAIPGIFAACGAMAGSAIAEFVNLAIQDDCAKLEAWRERVSVRPSASVAT